MPDLDLMPRGHVLPTAPRPPAGLGDVLTRATRRRRRQQAGAVATGAAACAAVLAFTMVTGGAVESLGVTPAHPTDGKAPGVTAPERSDANDALQPAAPATTQRTNVSGTATASSAPAAEQPVAAAAGSVNTAQQAKSGGEVGPPHTMTAYDASRPCNGWGSNAAEGWCGYYDGARSGTAGKPVQLAETLCRLPGRGTGTLLSEDGQQAEFKAMDKDARHVWTWSTGHRFSKRGTSLTVPAGSCVRWQVTWRVVDDKGGPLAPGAYQLIPQPWMHQASSTAPASVWTDANVIAFTVTR